MRLSRFIEATDAATTAPEIFSLLQRAAKARGFDRIAYCALTHHGSYKANGNPPPAVAHNFPDEWRKFYFEQHYQYLDPVLMHAPHLARPFLWDDLEVRFDLTDTQLRIMREAEDAGLYSGVGVPLYGPEGEVCLMSFAASEPHSDPRAMLSELRAIAAQFQLVYGTVGVGRVKQSEARYHKLSSREQECLVWVALGKSSREAGQLLGITENTVNHYLKNLYMKLGVHTRAAAVFQGLRHRILR